MNAVELEMEYRQALEDQVEVVLNNAQRIKNAINTWPVNKVGQGLIQYGLDVDLKTSYKIVCQGIQSHDFFGKLQR